jgi:hypothetical protein
MAVCGSCRQKKQQSLQDPYQLLECTHPWRQGGKNAKHSRHHPWLMEGIEMRANRGNQTLTSNDRGRMAVRRWVVRRCGGERIEFLLFVFSRI